MSEGRWRFSVTAPDWGEDHLTLDAIVAFVDEELEPGPRARATRHAAGCRECAAQVVAQTQARVALRTAAGPALPSSLLSALRSIPQHADLPPAPAGLAMTEDGEMVVPAGPEPTQRSTQRSTPRPTPRPTPRSIGGSDQRTRPPALPDAPGGARPAPAAPPAGLDRTAADHGRRFPRRMRLSTGVAVSGLALGALAFGATAATPTTPSPAPERGVLGGSVLGGSVVEARLRVGQTARTEGAPSADAPRERPAPLRGLW